MINVIIKSVVATAGAVVGWKVVSVITQRDKALSEYKEAQQKVLDNLSYLDIK